MSQNLLKRIITSIFLLSLLFFVNFSHKYIFILSILVIGIIICIEANNLFSKLLKTKHYKRLYYLFLCFFNILLFFFQDAQF